MARFIRSGTSSWGQWPASSTTSVVWAGAWRWKALRRPAALIHGSRIHHSNIRGACSWAKSSSRGWPREMSNTVRNTPKAPGSQEGEISPRFHPAIQSLNRKPVIAANPGRNLLPSKPHKSRLGTDLRHEYKTGHKSWTGIPCAAGCLILVWMSVAE